MSVFNIFIGGLTYDETPETLLAELKPSYPTLSSARVIRDEAGRSKGFGFLSFGAEAEGRRCIQERNGSLFRGRTLKLNDSHHRADGGAPAPAPPFFAPQPAFPGFPGFPQPHALPGGAWPVPPPVFPFLPPPGFPALPPSAPAPPPPPFAPPPLESEGVTTVYVGNASANASEAELFALFAPHGPVSGINFQRAKSCAFVQFRFRACAEAALARLAGALLAGVPMRLSWGRHVAKNGAPPAAPLPPPPPPPPAAVAAAAAAAWGAAHRPAPVAHSAPPQGHLAPPAPAPPAHAAAAAQQPQRHALRAEAKRVFLEAADGGDASKRRAVNAVAANALWGFAAWQGEGLAGFA
jgi:nucleolysin TIA-1/TIAR